MDRNSPFRILAGAEFDGLSFEEKLAYLDLQLANLHGTARRNRLAPVETAQERDVEAKIAA